MMGVQTAEARLFYDFCLDDHVPSDHLLRSIDGHFDLDGLRQTAGSGSFIIRFANVPYPALCCLSVSVSVRESGRCAGERRTSTDQRWYFRVRMWALRPKAGTDRVTRIAKAQIRTRPGALPLIQRQPQIAPPQSSRKFNPAS